MESVFVCTSFCIDCILCMQVPNKWATKNYTRLLDERTSYGLAHFRKRYNEFRTFLMSCFLLLIFLLYPEPNIILRNPTNLTSYMFTHCIHTYIPALFSMDNINSFKIKSNSSDCHRTFLGFARILFSLGNSHFFTFVFFVWCFHSYTPFCMQL